MKKSPEVEPQKGKGLLAFQELNFAYGVSLQASLVVRLP